MPLKFGKISTMPLHHNFCHLRHIIMYDPIPIPIPIPSSSPMTFSFSIPPAAPRYAASSFPIPRVSFSSLPAVCRCFTTRWWGRSSTVLLCSPQDSTTTRRQSQGCSVIGRCVTCLCLKVAELCVLDLGHGAQFPSSTVIALLKPSMGRIPGGKSNVASASYAIGFVSAVALPIALAMWRRRRRRRGTRGMADLLRRGEVSFGCGRGKSVSCACGSGELGEERGIRGSVSCN